MCCISYNKITFYEEKNPFHLYIYTPVQPPVIAIACELVLTC